VALTVGSSNYKRARILAFLNPWKDAQNTGFHIVQSLLALGSGGIFGLGLGASRQKFFYLPEAHTDFIFAVVGEELGMLGTVMVLALFSAFAIRAFMLAQRCTDRFGYFLIVGCAMLIVIQAFINIGVVTSSWPVTGVPLPFISFGGTSLIVSLVAVALIMNVARRTQ
jgi:cell division protein FtsW